MDGCEQDLEAFGSNQASHKEHLEPFGVSAVERRHIDARIDAQRRDFHLIPVARIGSPHELARAIVADGAHEGGMAHLFGQVETGYIVELAGSVDGRGKSDRKNARQEQFEGRSEVRMYMAEPQTRHPGAGHHRFPEIDQIEECLVQVQAGQAQGIEESGEISARISRQRTQVRAHYGGDPGKQHGPGLREFFALLRAHGFRGAIGPAHGKDNHVHSKLPQRADFPQDKCMTDGGILTHQVSEPCRRS